MFRRCPYCHRWVLNWLYDSHEKKHTQRRDDGQMTDHVTAPPTERYTGSLADVPQAYHHSVCDTTTGMPEEIIRTYLVNPMAYNDSSFCCGCGDYIDMSQLVWRETGENVLDYMGKLRLQYLRATYGMNLPDHPEGVTLTPKAEEKVREILAETGPDAVLVLQLPDPGSTGYGLTTSPSHDESLGRLQKVSGIRIVVSNEQQADNGAGIVIDYKESPSVGFSIVRLYAPSMA